MYARTLQNISDRSLFRQLNLVYETQSIKVGTSDDDYNDNNSNSN